jgi:hypothetical protein
MKQYQNARKRLISKLHNDRPEKKKILISTVRYEIIFFGKIVKKLTAFFGRNYF